MTKNITFIAIYFTSIIVFAQQNHQISLYSGYTNQSFYSMQNGEILNTANDNWDLAFSTDSYSTSIRTNDGKEVQLYTYQSGDINSWSSINNNDINNLPVLMFNSDTSWEYGAFNINQTGGFDYGWGVYNLQTHHVIGDSLYLINTVNGNWKKLWIKSKISGDYEIKYANLDGSNEIETTVLASNYTNKNFIYYSLDDDLIIDREPDKNNWDITFTKYKTLYPFQGGFMPYSVTGTLHNAGLEVAQADNIQNPLSYNNHNSHSFSNSINTIGFDWKEFNGTNYSIVNNRCYFIIDKSSNIWRITFTGFDGMSTGNIEFNTELIQSTDIENINSSSTVAIYPNPVSKNQQVTIIYDVSNYNTTASIRIHDIFGKEVYLSKIYKDGLMLHSINTQNLKKGIYMLSINIDGMQKTERLVIN